MADETPPEPSLSGSAEPAPRADAPAAPRRRKKASSSKSNLANKLGPTPPGFEMDPVAQAIIASAKPRDPLRKPKNTAAGNPGKRCTAQEVQERIVGTAKMLVKRLHKYQIRAFLVQRFDLSARMADAYISRARQYLIQQSKKPRDDFVAEAIGFYEEILRDPESSRAEQCEAQAALRQMLGLDMPVRIAPTTPDGETPLPINLVATLPLDQLAVLRAAHAQLQRAASEAAIAQERGNLTPSDKDFIDVQSTPRIEGFVGDPQVDDLLEDFESSGNSPESPADATE